MLDFVFESLAWLLSFFYSIIPDYAVAIALLTLAVMLVLFPLNAKGMRSMAAMARLNPELKRIQAKHKNDRVKQNEEVMALFKSNNVTPFGGCLPFLFQAPVLFVMYHVIRGLTNIGADGTFDPKYLDHSSELYRQLDGRTEMISFGIDLAKSASVVLKTGFVVAIPFLVLIAGVVATGYYQQRMISRRTASSTQDNPMAKQMQTMTRILPLMYLVFGFTLPAGLNVYFFVSSLFRIGQQALIYKLDPSLLPASTTQTVASREVVDKPTKSVPPAGKTKGSAAPGPGKPTPRNGSPNGSTQKKAAAQPARTANRSKKKRRR